MGCCGAGARCLLCGQPLRGPSCCQSSEYRERQERQWALIMIAKFARAVGQLKPLTNPTGDER